MDVEASRAIRQAEVGASQKMIERTEACFGIKPEWIVADTAYGSASNLNWLVNKKGITPHVPVIDKSKRDDGETTLLYFASVLDCRSCPFKARCCPKAPVRRIPRSIYEEARDVARALA